MEDFKLKLFEIINSNHSNNLMYIKFKLFCDESVLKSHIRYGTFIFIFKDNCAIVYDNNKENNKGMLLAMVDNNKGMDIPGLLEDIKEYFVANYKNIDRTYVTL